MSPGENPGCNPLHHWYRSISLHGGRAGKMMIEKTNRVITMKNQKRNKIKKNTGIVSLAHLKGVQVPKNNKQN